MTYQFVCRCGWSGDELSVVLDAHANPWCPTCGKPVDFKVVPP